MSGRVLVDRYSFWLHTSSRLAQGGLILESASVLTGLHSLILNWCKTFSAYEVVGPNHSSEPILNDLHPLESDIVDQVPSS